MKATEECLHIHDNKRGFRRKSIPLCGCISRVSTEDELIELAQKLGSKAATESYDRIKQNCDKGKVC